MSTSEAEEPLFRPLPAEEPAPAAVSTGHLPTPDAVRALLASGHERYRDVDEGAVADYIPALAGVAPGLFGACVAGLGPVTAAAVPFTPCGWRRRGSGGAGWEA